MECSYRAELPDVSNQLNTAKVKIGNVRWELDKPPVYIGEIVFFGETECVFGSMPTKEIDKCIKVTDTNLSDPLGVVCIGDTPRKFQYPYYYASGDYVVANTAICI